MKACICIKEAKSISGRMFKINCKYQYVSKVENPAYFIRGRYKFSVFYPVYYHPSNLAARFFTAVDFNEYFIDLQQHRQNLINRIL